jgi:hypothetical protein
MSTCNTHEFQNSLNKYYTSVICDPANFESVPDDIQSIIRFREMENDWMDWEETRIAAERIPSTKIEFLEWYEALKERHWQDISELFEFIEREAQPHHLAYYVALEEQVDGKFDDMVALAQLGTSGEEKLVIAENYWDEMGRGTLEKMHTLMFSQSGKYLQKVLAESDNEIDKLPPQALKNGNLQLMLGLRRRFIPRLLGAVGVMEDTASRRFQATVRGMRRCGFPEEVIAYHEEHIEFDCNHGEEWLAKVLLPMMDRNPNFLREVCIGMLMRYRVAVDYYAAVKSWIDSH